MNISKLFHNILTILVAILLFSLSSCNAEELTNNVIKNGDFTLGSSSWYARYWQKYKIDYLVTEDIKTFTEKIPSGFQLVVPVNNKNQSVRIMSEPFKVTKGAPFTCEVSLRIEGNPRNVLLKIMNAEHTFNKTQTVGNAWETIVLRNKFPATGNDHYRVELSAGAESVKIYIGSAKLLQKASSVAQRNDDFTFAARSVKPLSLYEQGDDVVYELFMSNQNNKPEKIGWVVANIYGKKLVDGILDVPSGISSKTISLGKLPLGWYSVVFFSKNDVLRPPIRRSLSVLPNKSERKQIDPKNSFFGTHTEVTNDGLLAARLMGFRWVRLNAPLITKWNAVEEKRGVFTYNDKAIADIRQQGIEIVGTLDRTALWASTGKDDPKTKSSNFYGAYAYFPNDWEAWDNYVSAVVARYKKDIKYWQIWNEPDIPFLVPPAGISNAAAYDSIVKRTAPIVHRINPEARILGGVAYLRPRHIGPGRQQNFIVEMEKLKTSEYFDVFTFHHYIDSHGKMTLLEDDLDFTRILFNNPNRRLWITELGFNCTKSSKYEFLNSNKCLSTLDAASLIVKYNVMLLSKGIERIFYYNAFFDTNGLGEFKPDVNVMWDSKEPRPIVAAYSIMTWMLDGSKFKEKRVTEKMQEYIFKSRTKTIKVLWSTDKQPQQYNLPCEGLLVSLDGSRTLRGSTFTISSEPIYLVIDDTSTAH